MDHAEVLDRLADAFPGAGKLGSVEADDSVQGQELRHHLETCDECRRELEAWQLTSAALAAATPDDLHAPSEARARVLATVAATGIARGGAGAAVAALPPLTTLPGGAARADQADRADQGRP